MLQTRLKYRSNLRKEKAHSSVLQATRTIFIRTEKCSMNTKKPEMIFLSSLEGKRKKLDVKNQSVWDLIRTVKGCATIGINVRNNRNN
jgi:hypothetical protein